MKVDVVELLNDGGLAVITVVGGVRSTVQLKVAGAPMPVASALAENVCGPSASPDAVNGDEQLLNAPESREHLSVPPAAA
jgi:hypothetical protein